jgi:hypothetical protein
MELQIFATSPKPQARTAAEKEEVRYTIEDIPQVKTVSVPAVSAGQHDPPMAGKIHVVRTKRKLVRARIYA